MGGCATKPKEFNTRAADSAPAAQPEPQDPVAPQESQNEAPLVDVSEPKEEGEKPAEPKAADAEVVPEEVAENVTPKPEDDKTEPEPEPKPEPEPEPETEPVAVESGEAKAVDEEAPKEEVKAEESKTEDSGPAEATEAKTSVEPPVTTA